MILASAVIISVIGAAYFSIERGRQEEEKAAEAVVSAAPSVVTAARPLIPGRLLSEADIRWREVIANDVEKLLEEGAFVARDEAERQSQVQDLVGREVLDFLSDNSVLTAASVAEPLAVVEAESIQLEKGRYILTPEMLLFVERHGLGLDYNFVVKTDDAYQKLATGRAERLADGTTFIPLTAPVVERLAKLRDDGVLYLELDGRQRVEEGANVSLSMSASEVLLPDTLPHPYQLWVLSKRGSQTTLRKISADFGLVYRNGRYELRGKGTDVESFVLDFQRGDVFVLNENSILRFGSGACTDGMCNVAISAEELGDWLSGLRFSRIAVERQNVGLLEEVVGSPSSAEGSTEETPSAASQAGFSVTETIKNGQ